MAIQDAKNFLDAVDQDAELRTRVRGAFHQMVETAREHGYNINAKDLADELRRRWGMNTQPDDVDPDTFCIG